LTRITALFQLAIAASCLGVHSLVSQAPAARGPEKPLTVEAIFAHGHLIGDPPEDLTWSPDGKHLTYLDGGELIDLAPGLGGGSGKPHTMVSRAKLASLEGTDGSETDRDHRDRYKMASYLWAPDSSHLLFDSNGRLWLYDLHSATGVQVGFTGAASGDDPKFSPSGEYLSFIRDHGLSVIRLKEPGAQASAVSAAPRAGVLNGEVDWVYEEELETRSNYFWSPDSKNLAYLQMNETDVPEYPITDWIPTHATVNFQRYPQPGDPNPAVRVGVVSAGGGKTLWIKLPIQDGQDYIPRFGWVDRKTLWIETVTRDQKHRNIYFADAVTGLAQAMIQITDDEFLDDNYDVSVGYGTIVLTNWSDGHNHLYLYSYDHTEPGAAKLERQLTKGDFEVEEILRVDHAARLIDYSSNEGNLTERQLWQVNFDGERKQLTSDAGVHTGSFAPVGGAFVDEHTARVEPPSERVCEAPGKCYVFWQTRALEPYHLRAPEQFEVKAHDGSTLYATLLLPGGAANAAGVPLILNPYGGPGPQPVSNRWGNDSLLFDELLAQHGFAVLHADNRGTGNRGRAFAQAAWHNFGPIQLEDQLAVLDAALARYPQLDNKRVGFWGWSWGGTFTLYAMSHSDRFRTGVAVAPVTDWHNYDSIYTERYMSLPAEFPDGYRDFSVVNSVAGLKGHLLIALGTGDDNVHMENTVQYVQKLIEAGIPYDLQIYPRKTHSISGPDVRTHLYKRILAEFEEYLKPEVVAATGQ
jgi:dipeptidyl-peptidase 4